MTPRDIPKVNFGKFPGLWAVRARAPHVTDACTSGCHGGRSADGQESRVDLKLRLGGSSRLLPQLEQFSRVATNAAAKPVLMSAAPSHGTPSPTDLSPPVHKGL